MGVFFLFSVNVLSFSVISYMKQKEVTMPIARIYAPTKDKQGDKRWQ